MRIGINGRFLAAKRTGVQRAAFNLIQSLFSVDRENEYIVFAPQDFERKDNWNFENVRVIPCQIRKGESLRNHIWEQMFLPKLAKSHNIDILHSPANTAPFFYRGKSIINIHDLCFVVNPQWYSWSFRTSYNLLVPRLAKKATRVITNSNNSRNDLLQFCDLPADRVSQVYWAVDDLFHQPDQSSTHGVDVTDYILYVGTLDPRKNIRTLLDAYVSMRAKNPDVKTKLVLIGGESPLFAEVRLNVTKYKEDIIFKGFVDDVTLREFYRKATLFVYPSLYEGFGLPPLEAMVSGAPVVTSLTSSIPEVVGDAAVLVSPYDANQLGEAMATCIKDKDLREKLRERGYEQVKKFNWNRVARNTLAIYYEVFNSEPSLREDHEKHFLPKEVWRKLRGIEEAKDTLSLGN